MTTTDDDYDEGHKVRNGYKDVVHRNDTSTTVLTTCSATTTTTMTIKYVDSTI